MKRVVPFSLVGPGEMCDADAWVALVHGYIELAPIGTRLSRTLSFAGKGVRCEARFLRDGEESRHHAEGNQGVRAHPQKGG